MLVTIIYFNDKWIHVDIFINIDLEKINFKKKKLISNLYIFFKNHMEIDSVSKSCRNKTKIKKKRSGKKLSTMIFDKTYLFCIVLKKKGL